MSNRLTIGVAMQDAALNFLTRIRSTLEAAEGGKVTAEDLAAGRNAMNDLLDLDWVMPRAVSEVSMHWKLFEESLRAILEGCTSGQARSEQLEAAWSAYRDIEASLRPNE